MNRRMRRDKRVGAVLAGVTEASPWWAPHVHADRRPFLKVRSRVLAACRQFFAREHFTEVDVPALQVSPGNEAHLSAFATQLIARGREANAALSCHLAGICHEEAARRRRDADFHGFAHAFRNRERGPLHHPEFTLLEWYRVGEDYARLIEDCAGLLSEAAMAAGVDTFVYRGRTHARFRRAGESSASPMPSWSTR